MPIAFLSENEELDISCSISIILTVTQFEIDFILERVCYASHLLSCYFFNE